jgi:hypothetical protein
MRNNFVRIMFPLSIFLLFPLALFSQTASHSTSKKDGVFNPRDLTGVWWVADPGADKLLARGEKGDASKCQTCHIPEHTMPEPELTPWAKENLTFKNEMSAGAMAAPAAPMGHMGASPRQYCDPIGVPAQFWHIQLAPFEFVMTPGRIFQFFETQNEWRTIWMNRDHPAKLDPTYMGDSIGKWDGDTLMIDTVGFNGKTMIEPVGVDHLMSDAFHLVERWRRVSPEKMEVDVTYYDPKVWGDKAWGGLKKEFVLQPKMQLMEAFCTQGDLAEYNRRMGNAFAGPTSKDIQSKPAGGTPTPRKP